jgi:hypothetical protein
VPSPVWRDWSVRTVTPSPGATGATGATMIRAIYPAGSGWRTWRLHDTDTGHGFGVGLRGVVEALAGSVLLDDGTVRLAYADGAGRWRPVGPDRVVLPPGQDRPTGAQITALREERRRRAETEAQDPDG